MKKKGAKNGEKTQANGGTGVKCLDVEFLSKFLPQSWGKMKHTGEVQRSGGKEKKGVNY